jgi:hypothetical protein
MILFWIVSAGFNLVGALLTHQMLSQVLLASYFLLIDTLLGAQYVYYTVTNWKKKTRAKLQYSQLLANDDDPENITAELSQRSTKLSGIIFLMGATSIAVHSIFAPEHSLGTFTSRTITVRHCAVILTSKSYDGDTDPWPLTGWMLVGYVIGCISAILLICSRVPQIIRNVNLPDKPSNNFSSLEDQQRDFLQLSFS